MESLCGAAEVLFARQRNEIFKLTQDHDALYLPHSWRPPPPRSIANGYRRETPPRWRSPPIGAMKRRDRTRDKMPPTQPDRPERSRANSVRVVATLAAAAVLALAALWLARPPPTSHPPLPA